jgi:hypothetical protein
MENPETDTTEGKIYVTEWRIQRQRQPRGNKRYRMENPETETTEGKINVTEWRIQRQIQPRGK